MKGELHSGVVWKGVFSHGGRAQQVGCMLWALLSEGAAEMYVQLSRAAG